jgi:hypothetical protein
LEFISTLKRAKPSPQPSRNRHFDLSFNCDVPGTLAHREGERSGKGGSPVWRQQGV